MYLHVKIAMATGTQCTTTQLKLLFVHLYVHIYFVVSCFSAISYRICYK